VLAREALALGVVDGGEPAAVDLGHRATLTV
jgi:hypothetical protein